MKKLIPIVLILVFSLAIISALDLEVQKNELSNVLIKELNGPAFYELKIKNLGLTNDFQIFSYVGVEMMPREFSINENSTKTIRIEAKPSRKLMDGQDGWFSFEYRIAGKEPGTFRDSLKFKIVPLAELMEFKQVLIFPKEEETIIQIKNKEDISIENLEIKLISEFFEGEYKLSFEPFEEKNITLTVKKDIQNLEAGMYGYQIDLGLSGAESSATAELNYLEKGGLLTATSTEGLIIKTTVIEKINAGNIPTTATITQKKNIITRLFTTHSDLPATTERSGFFVKYSWERVLKPNESIKITSKTNYTIPVLILILILFVIIIARFYVRSNLIMKKRVSFVRTKGGEFALKVRIKLKAKKRLDGIEISDRIPAMTKIHEKFGTKPDKVDGKSRRISWTLDSMNAGEERTFTYLIYSKIKVIGTFELPLATASYKLDGQVKHTQSNKTSFAAEGS